MPTDLFFVRFSILAVPVVLDSAATVTCSWERGEQWGEENEDVRGRRILGVLGGRPRTVSDVFDPLPCLRTALSLGPAQGKSGQIKKMREVPS